MAAKKPARTKPQSQKQRPGMFERISTALNPMTYTRPTAQAQMENWKAEHGGGARRDRIDQIVDTAVGGRPAARTSPQATYSKSKQRSRSR